MVLDCLVLGLFLRGKNASKICLDRGFLRRKQAVMKSGDHLPKVPVKAPRFKLHISYFLQKCKKGKPKKEIRLSDMRKHKLTVFRQGKDTYIAVIRNCIRPDLFFYHYKDHHFLKIR